MDFQVRKASKKKARGRIAIDGPTGGGKTYTSLLVAKHMIKEPFKLPDNVTSRITVIDTERNSAENYEDEYSFNVIELPPEGWNPKHYTEALRKAELTADVVILDSISHEWAWCLQEVDRIQPRFKGNKWAAWSEVRPPHDNFVDAIMGSRAHVIATIRAKMATVQDKEDGRTVIREVGLEAKQDDQIKYAFSVCLRMDEDHTGVITKTRCKALDKAIFPMPGEDFARVYGDWLATGIVDNKVAGNIDDAIALAFERAMAGATQDERKVTYVDAKQQLTDWCKARGKTKEEHDAAQAEVVRRCKAASPKPSAVPADPPLTDAEHARRIDEGKA